MVPPSALPSSNVLYMLFIIGNLGKVEGRTKLFKLLHLLQVEGHARLDEPDEEQARGFTDYAALGACLQNNLIRETLIATPFGAPCRVYQLTENGSQSLIVFEKQMKEKEKTQLTCILQEHKDKTGAQLIEYTHARYIDGYEASNTKKLANQYFGTINHLQEIMAQLVQNNQDPDMYVMVGKLDHVKGILSVLKKSDTKKIQAGNLLFAMDELIRMLSGNNYKADDNVEDIFEYIENYADKEKILPRMASTNLEQLTEEDKKCLSQFLNQVKPQLFS